MYYIRLLVELSKFMSVLDHPYIRLSIIMYGIDRTLQHLTQRRPIIFVLYSISSDFLVMLSLHVRKMGKPIRLLGLKYNAT